MTGERCVRMSRSTITLRAPGLTFSDRPGSPAGWAGPTHSCAPAASTNNTVSHRDRVAVEPLVDLVTLDSP